MIRSTKSLRSLAVVASIAALTLSACGSDDGDDNTPAAGADIANCGKSLAFLGATTGEAAELGLNMTGGIELAIKEFNDANPDCTITLETFDSQGSPEKAPALATEIINNKDIVGLIGPGFSGESLATGKTLYEAGLPSISPSATNVTITQQGWTTWHRVIGNDAAQGAADAKYLTETVGATKVFVVDDGQDYSKGLATVVTESLGAAAAGADQITTGQSDLSAVVTAIKSSGADAVFYGGYYAEAAKLVKQLRQADFEGTFMSGDGSQDPAFVKAAGDAADGAILSAPAGPAPADFAAKYKAANGKDAGLYSTQAYDAANIFLAAFKAGKESAKDINEFIGSYNAEGASGPIEFDDKGDITASVIYAYLVKDGVMDVKNPTPIQ